MDNRNVLARWERQLSETDGLTLQFYYDYYHARFLGEEESHNTFDLDFQHHLKLGTRQDLIWGVGYRYLDDTIIGTPSFSTKREHQGNNLFSAFIHDEIALMPDRLALILGVRLEHNDYTGFEVQPNARLIWTPTARHSVWASISRAVRTPSQGDRDLRTSSFQVLPPSAATLGLPMRIGVEGSDSFKSETVIAYELGYRTTPAKDVSIDIALFFNQYDKLRSLVAGTPYPEPSIPPYTNFAQTYSAVNAMYGHTYGAELSATWKPFNWWRLQASYSYLCAIMKLDAGQGSLLPEMYRSNIANSAPKHQGSIRTGFDLGKQVELDLWLRAVDEIPYITGTRIPGYLTMDARVAWKPSKTWELAVVGQNLLQPRHQEYQNDLIWNSASEVPRGVYGKLTWKF
jgi:iron complex outermembrane receptor protein